MTTDDGLDSDRILNVYQANNGDVWIGTDKGIIRYNGVFEQRLLLKIEESSLLGEDSNSILELPSGQILARGVDRLGKVKINIFDGQEWNQEGFFHDNDIWVSLWPEFAVKSEDNLSFPSRRKNIKLKRLKSQYTIRSIMNSNFTDSIR